VATAGNAGCRAGDAPPLGGRADRAAAADYERESAAMTRIEIPPFDFHPGQRALRAALRRFTVLAAGRRFGKTKFALEWLLFEPGGAIDGYPVAWFAPNYKFLAEVLDDAIGTLRPIATRIDRDDKRIALATGGKVDFWTLEDPSAGRGRRYRRVVFDEAAHSRNLRTAWEQAVSPTLTDLGGEALFCSTPLGRNYFWDLSRRAAAEPREWACFTAPTASNPHIAPAEIERMRRQLPERVFAQEYQAAFLEDGGGVFRGVAHAPRCAWADRAAAAAPSSRYAIGVDWGRSEDFTVFAVLDCAPQEPAGVRAALVHIDRFTGVGYELQTGRLAALWERFARCPILAEANSMGGPLVENLRRRNMPVRPFTTTHASKAEAVEALADDERAAPVAAELLSFAQQRLPSGAIRYAAPDGQHDDCVMALAIAWSAVARPAVQYAASAGRLAVPGLR
jgi:hypothetical protein